MKQTEILTRATHVNGWEPAVYMSCMSQNFRLFHVSNLSVRNFRIFLLMYTGSSTSRPHRWGEADDTVNWFTKTNDFFPGDNAITSSGTLPGMTVLCPISDGALSGTDPQRLPTPRLPLQVKQAPAARPARPRLPRPCNMSAYYVTVGKR